MSYRNILKIWAFSFILYFFIIPLIVPSSVPVATAQADTAISVLKCVGATVVISAVTCAIIGFFTGGACSIDLAYIQKEYIEDPIVRCLSRAMVDKLNANIISLAQTGGRNGGATFVRNYRNFITEGQYRGEDTFRVILGQTKVCVHLQDSINTLFNPSYVPGAPPPYYNTSLLYQNNTRVNNLDPFTYRGSCTLPSGFDFNAFQQDFSGNGGWDAFERLLQPQNNFAGLYLLALDELGQQRSLDETADVQEALAGQGFTAVRDICQDIADPSISLSGLSGSGSSSQPRCKFLGESITPAKLLGESAQRVIDDELDWLTSSDELSELIIAAISSIMSRLTGFLLVNTGLTP